MERQCSIRPSILDLLSSILTPEKDMPEYLFVYGTLRPGMAPRRFAQLMEKVGHLGKGSTPGRLYDLEGYPGAVIDLDCETKIRGEVFQLPDDGATLAAMDAYEGFDARYPESSLFVRRKCKVTLKDGPELVCWIYVYNWQVSPEALIRSGDYLFHRKLQSMRGRPK
jgi:gamma-glutamylcyclotransferase (GGCT)/AIG2-like uncharacterized protein YtfP